MTSSSTKGGAPCAPHSFSPLRPSPSLSLLTASAAPPANDSFATPTSVGSVPFSDSTDLDGAGVEAGEQHYCNFKTRSVWYRLEASVNGPVSIDLSGSSPGVVGTVYRHFGGGVGNLGFEGCIFGGGLQLTIQQSGTYYIQVVRQLVGLRVRSNSASM